MNLAKKRLLASRIMGVGKNKIRFNTERLDEIKEAITSQDIRDLASSGAITLETTKGRKGKSSGARKRHDGKIRKKLNKRKRVYVALVRKLRKYVALMKKQKTIDNSTYILLRKKIKAGIFKSKNQMMEAIKNENSAEKKKKGE